MSKRRKKWEKTWSSSDSEQSDETQISTSRPKWKRAKAGESNDSKETSNKGSSSKTNQKPMKSKVEVKDEDPHLMKLRDTIYSPSSNSYYAELPGPRRRVAFFDETDEDALDESWKKDFNNMTTSTEHEETIEPDNNNNNNNNNSNNTIENELISLVQGDRIQRAIHEVRRVQNKTLSILQADEDSEVDSEDFYIYSSRLNSTLTKSLYNSSAVSTYELFGNLEEEDPLTEATKPEEPRFAFLPYASSDSDSDSDDLRFGTDAMFPDEENLEDRYYQKKLKAEDAEKRQHSDPLKTKQENRDKLIRKCFGTSEMERKNRERSFHGSSSSGVHAFFLNIKDVESLEAQSESPSDVDDALQICLHENNVSIIVIGNEVRATVCSTYTVVLLMSPPAGVMNQKRLLNSVCSCQVSNVNNNNLFCKHIVAVLLVSVFRPQKLLGVDTIKKKLASMNREDLEAILINQFVINPTQWTTFESSLSLVEKNTKLMDLTQPLAITPIQPISEEHQAVLEKQLGHSVDDVDDIKQLIESALQQYEHIGAAPAMGLELSMPTTTREEGINIPAKLLSRILSDDAEKVAKQQSPLQVAVKQIVAKSRQRWLACDYNSALLSLLTVSEYMVVLYKKQKDFGILGPEHTVHPLYYGYRSHVPYSRKETVMTSLLQILNKVWVEYMISYPLSASSRMQWAEKLAEWGSLFSDAIPLAKNGWEDPNLREIMNRTTIIESTVDMEQSNETGVTMENDDKFAAILDNMDSTDPEATLLRSVSQYVLTKRSQDRERANLENNESEDIHPVLKETKEVLLTRIHYLLSKGLFIQSLNLSRSAGVVIGEAMSLIYMNQIQEGVLVALNKVETICDLYSLIHILKEHSPFGVFEIGTKLLKLLATESKNTSETGIPYWKKDTENSQTLTHNGKDIQLTPVSLAEFMIHYAHQKSHTSLVEEPEKIEKEGNAMEAEKTKLANVDSLTRLCARKAAVAYLEELPQERFELLSSLAPELQSMIMIELLCLKLPDVLPSKDLTHCAKLFNKLAEYQVCFHLLVKSISAPPGSSDSTKVVLSNPIASDTLMWAAELACSFPGEREAQALALELNKQATKSNLFRIAHAVGLSTYMLPGSCRGPTNVLNAKQLFDVARIFYRSKKYQASLTAATGCFRVRRTYRYSYSIQSQDADKLQVLAWIIVRLLPVVDKQDDPVKIIVTQLLSSKVPSTMLFFVHYLLELNKLEEDPECIAKHKQQIQQLIDRALRCKKGIGRNFFELAQELDRHGDQVNALKLAIKSYGLRGFFQTSMPLPYGRDRNEATVTPKNAYEWVLDHLEHLTDEEIEKVFECRKFILSERTLAFAIAKILEKRNFVDIAAEVALRSLDIPHTMMSSRPSSSLGEIVAWLLVLLSEHPEITSQSSRTKVKLLDPEALEKKCEELLNSSDCFVVSRNLYELGNKAGAFKLGQRALACSPRSTEIAEWLGTLAVELGQPVTAQITALVLFQEKPSLAHYKLLKERGVPAEKIEFLLMKVSKSTKDIGILEVLLQKLMWDDAFAFVDRFECNPKALKYLFEKLETSSNNNNNKSSTKLTISNSLRKDLLQRCVQRLETFLFSFHWQNQGDIEENVLIMQELLPKYAPDLMEYFSCIQIVSRSINSLSASNAQYVRLINELEALYKILEKGGKYHVWRDVVDYVKAKHKLKKKLINMMNVKNW